MNIQNQDEHPYLENHHEHSKPRCAQFITNMNIQNQDEHPYLKNHHQMLIVLRHHVHIGFIFTHVNCSKASCTYRVRIYTFYLVCLYNWAIRMIILIWEQQYYQMDPHDVRFICSFSTCTLCKSWGMLRNWWAMQLFTFWLRCVNWWGINCI